MKKLMATLEDMMVAITFAESGEYDEATRHAGSATSCQDDSFDSLPVMSTRVAEGARK